MSKRRRKRKQKSFIKIKSGNSKVIAKGSAAIKVAERAPEVLEMCHRQNKDDKALKILNVFNKLGSLILTIGKIIHDLFPYNYYHDGYEFKKMQTI